MLIDRTAHEVTTAYTDSTGLDSREVADRFGKCLAEYDQVRTEKVMALPLLGEEQNKSFGEFNRASDECFLVIGGELHLGWLTIVGRMAEFEFETRYKAADVDALIAAATSVEPRSGMENLAFCLVRANPAGAMRLIGTPIASPDETEAFQALAGDLGKCLPAGQSIKLNVSATRDAYAAGLYLLATRAKLAQAAK